MGAWPVKPGPISKPMLSTLVSTSSIVSCRVTVMGSPSPYRYRFASRLRLGEYIHYLLGQFSGLRDCGQRSSSTRVWCNGAHRRVVLACDVSQLVWVSEYAHGADLVVLELERHDRERPAALAQDEARLAVDAGQVDAQRRRGREPPRCRCHHERRHWPAAAHGPGRGAGRLAAAVRPQHDVVAEQSRQPFHVAPADRAQECVQHAAMGLRRWTEPAPLPGQLSTRAAEDLAARRL